MDSPWVPSHVSTKKSRATWPFKLGPLPDFLNCPLNLVPSMLYPWDPQFCWQFLWRCHPVSECCFHSCRCISLEWSSTPSAYLLFSLVIPERHDSMTLFLLSFLHVKCSSVISDPAWWFFYIYLAVFATCLWASGWTCIVFLLWYSAGHWEINQCLLDWFESQCPRCPRKTLLSLSK